MTGRENTLGAIRFERPDYIPMEFHVNAACWHHYDQDALQDLIEEHSLLFPNFDGQDLADPHYRPNQPAGEPYTDPWGCVWKTSEDGITGSVHGHPLEDWDDFDDYEAPDPEVTDGTFRIDWQEIERRVKRQKKDGELVRGGLPHGHTVRGRTIFMSTYARQFHRCSPLSTAVQRNLTSQNPPRRPFLWLYCPAVHPAASCIMALTGSWASAWTPHGRGWR